MIEWHDAVTDPPHDWVSVLGHMTDAGDFPSVRECYLIGKEYFFPALREIHPVDKWAHIPTPED